MRYIVLVFCRLRLFGLQNEALARAALGQSCSQYPLCNDCTNAPKTLATLPYLLRIVVRTFCNLLYLEMRTHLPRLPPMHRVSGRREFLWGGSEGLVNNMYHHRLCLQEECGCVSVPHMNPSRFNIYARTCFTSN